MNSCRTFNNSDATCRAMTICLHIFPVIFWYLMLSPVDTLVHATGDMTTPGTSLTHCHGHPSMLNFRLYNKCWHSAKLVVVKKTNNNKTSEPKNNNKNCPKNKCKNFTTAPCTQGNTIETQSKHNRKHLSRTQTALPAKDTERTWFETLHRPFL